MENFRGLPSDAYKKLQCFLCNNCLSYFPISRCSNNHSICGRCAVPDGRRFFRNEVFEVVAEYVKFPCRYKIEGCCAELVPNKVPQHEEDECLFRVVQCIIRKPYTCTYKGSLSTLLQHCKEDHTELVLKDGEFLMDLADDKVYDRVFQHKEKMLIVSTKLDSGSKTLHVAICNDPYRVNLSMKCKLILESLERDNIKLFFDFNTCGYTNMVFNKLNLISLTDGENKVEVRGKISVDSELDSETEDGEVKEEEKQDRSKATFRYTVQHFSQLKGSVLSPLFYVRNLPWRLKVMPWTSLHSLGLFLQCNEESKSRLWSCYAKAELRLLSVRPDVETFSKRFEHLFSLKESDWGYKHFMAWNDVLDPEKGYIKDDAITLEVYVSAGVPVGVFRDSRKRTSSSTGPNRRKKNR